jgi:guanosine-3',5'-bis(diphosphate) 3'-pyrophosphohydrolase
MRRTRSRAVGLPLEHQTRSEFDEAVVFTNAAYADRLRRNGRTAEHPIAVAELLAADGQPQTVVVAGLLHDVLEDTGVTQEELTTRFGSEVARIVTALTQDESVARYKRRKAALRKRTLEGGPEAAAVALADKIAKLRDARERPRRRKLEHYRATLQGIEDRHGPSRLSKLLRQELDHWQT